MISEEKRRKLSLATKRQWARMSKEERDRRSKSVSTSAIKGWSDPERRKRHCERNSKRMLEKWKDPIYLEMMREVGKLSMQKLHSENVDAIERALENSLANWNDPKFVEAALKRMAKTRSAQGCRNPTGPEVILYVALGLCDINFEIQVPIKLRKSFTVCDAIVRDAGLAIYSDSKYWHSLPGVPDRDRSIREELRMLGYSVFCLDQDRDFTAEFSRLVETLELILQAKLAEGTK